MWTFVSEHDTWNPPMKYVPHSKSDWWYQDGIRRMYRAPWSPNSRIFPGASSLLDWAI